MEDNPTTDRPKYPDRSQATSQAICWHELMRRSGTSQSVSVMPSDAIKEQIKD